MLHRTPCLLAFASAIFISGCQTLPVVDLPETADPAFEISATDSLLHDAERNQANVLAPAYFNRGQKKLTQAKQEFASNGAKVDVLRRIAEARANLAKAAEVAAIGAAAMPDVVSARAAALQAGADSYQKNEFDRADAQLQDLGGALEDGDTKAATTANAKLAQAYSTLELASLNFKYLGRAQRLFDQAVKEGAEKRAPRTFATAKEKLTEAKDYISRNRQDAAGNVIAAAVATAAANDLLLMSNATRAMTQKDPEAFLLQREQIQAKLADKQDQLARNQAALTEAQSREVQLTEEKAFNDRFTVAKAQFKSHEAVVYRQGNGLVMRLKGLDFATGQAKIDPSQEPLLTKVIDVANRFAPAIVNIEGHTDATGSAAVNKKLSLARAEAVQEYLMQHGIRASLTVNAEGFGDTQPLASNKTAAGRTQNRRVDVIVIPENAPAASH